MPQPEKGLTDAEKASLCCCLISSIPEYPRRVVESCCGTKLVYDPMAADLREDAIEVAHRLLGVDTVSSD